MLYETEILSEKYSELQRKDLFKNISYISILAQVLCYGST